jgi:phosphoenolpyruvate carboxykinase (ATP)
MTNQMGIPSNYGLENHRLTNLRMIYWTLSTPPLIEYIVARREGILSTYGGVIVRTGHHTGRSANDKFTVLDDVTGDHIWWGTVNKSISREDFERLFILMTAYFQGRDVFVQDVIAGAHPDYSMPVRIVTSTAWHSLFARNMFIRLKYEDHAAHVPQFLVMHAPGFHANPEEVGTNSEAFIVVNFERRIVLIGGTSYAGEIKKSIFTVLNYYLPQRHILPMHCSANIGPKGDTAIFFGLSGTGKTTLSSDPTRNMIGDDEHGWANDGVFNFEGGCYAKTIRLSEELEPQIFAATRNFGTILENVGIDSNTRLVDFDDATFTENTRASYPLKAIPGVILDGKGGHPENIFFLTADAFGVMPPIAKLTPEQAMYHFISGYTSKLAGTEKGLGSEPQATFSACFGAPFLPLHPKVYTEMLGSKIKKHKSKVWLVNTGWTGGPFGVGERINLPYTRAMISAALEGKLDKEPYRTDPIFGLHVPEKCPGVPDEVLDPRGTWADSDEYDHKAKELANRFHGNFEQFAADVDPSVLEGGPNKLS